MGIWCLDQEIEVPRSDLVRAEDALVAEGFVVTQSGVMEAASPDGVVLVATARFTGTQDLVRQREAFSTAEYCLVAAQVSASRRRHRTYGITGAATSRRRGGAGAREPGPS